MGGMCNKGTSPPEGVFRKTWEQGSGEGETMEKKGEWRRRRRREEDRRVGRRVEGIYPKPVDLLRYVFWDI